MAPLIEVKDLKTHFFTPSGVVKAVNGISYSVDEGEVVAIVGESGCGKSVGAMSIMQLIPNPPGRIVNGEVWFQGKDLTQLSDAEMREIRGNKIAMVFQEPMTSLNPVLTVGRSLISIGTPLNGPSGSSGDAASSKAFSNCRWITEFKSLSKRSILSIVIETASIGESSLSLIIFAKETASTRDSSSLVSFFEVGSLIRKKLVPKNHLVIFRTLKIVINGKTANF